MSITNRLRNGTNALDGIAERLDREPSEYGLILLFLVSAVYAFIKASEFSEPAQQFPELTSGVVIVGTILLLFRNYLPGPVRGFVEEEASVLGATKEEDLAETAEQEMEEHQTETSAKEGKAAEAAAQSTATEDPVSTEQQAVDTDSYKSMVAPRTLIVITPLAILGYIVLGMLIGELWASPIFVALYLLLTGQRWYINAALTVLAWLIPYGFMVALNYDYHTGILIPDGLGILQSLGLL